MDGLLELRLLNPATDLHLYGQAYNWRRPKRRILPGRMSFAEFTDPNALAIGLFNGELLAVYFLHEVEPRVFQAHFTSRRNVSVVHYCDDQEVSEGNKKDDLQLVCVQQPSSQLSEALLPNTPKRVYEKLAENSQTNSDTETERYSTQHCGSLQATGQADSTTVRGMRYGARYSNASRGLQQAAGNSLAMSSMPSQQTQNCYCYHLAQKRFHESLLAGAAEVARLLLANGADEIHGWVTPRNRPLRSFLSQLGFTEAGVSEFPCASVSNRTTLPIGPRNQRREFVQYVLKAEAIAPVTSTPNVNAKQPDAEYLRLATDT
jgi:hypothetical protein